MTVSKFVRNSIVLAALFTAAMALAASPPAFAQGGTGGGPKPPPVESGANNLSVPVILSDGLNGAAPDTFPADAAWTFASITAPTTQCVTSAGTGGEVPTDAVCYWDGAKVWWLQQRQTLGNFWKAFSTGNPVADAKTVVTAIDWGDLLESSPSLNLRRIRTEVSLLKDALGTSDGDTSYSDFVPSSFPQTYPFSSPCAAPGTDSVTSVGCFAAFAMSVVPGTEQSINELQGTDFGIDTADGTEGYSTATGKLIDPRTVLTLTAAANGAGEPITVAPNGASLPSGFDSTIYSRCARLVIQKVTGSSPTWDAVSHTWSDADSPVVDLKAWNNTYSAEINSGGTLLYGFNWNAQKLSTGTYRLTFVLDNGNNGSADPTGAHCSVAPRTEFTADSFIANPGENATARIIPAGDPDLNDDNTVAGLSYIDINLKSKGSGGGGHRGGR